MQSLMRPFPGMTPAQNLSMSDLQASSTARCAAVWAFAQEFAAATITNTAAAFKTDFIMFFGPAIAGHSVKPRIMA
jgi:hypothetical protein